MSPRARTPFQRFTRSIRVAVKQCFVALAVMVVPRIYMAYMAFVYATSRVRINNMAELHDITRDHNGAVALLWHEEVFTVAYGYYQLRFNAHTLASHGDVGRIITRMLELCDFVVFRGGSSSKKSRRDTGVVRAMIAHMKETDGAAYGITVDGSQGPAYRMKPGGVLIARACGKPIVLGRTWYRRCIRLNTWDRTAIPLPFNEIAYYLRGPYPVPESVDSEEGLDEFVEMLEDDLIDLAKESYLDLGHELPDNLLKRSEVAQLGESEPEEPH